mgnify:CR=1 FL=1
MDDEKTKDLIKNLIHVGSGKIAHLNMGGCPRPDLAEGHKRRDKACPACKVLMQAAATEATTPKS